MADVSFNEEPQYRRPVTVKRSAFITFAYATGIPKNDTQAQYVLLGIVGVCVLIGIGVLFAGSLTKPAPRTPSDPTWPKPVSQYR